MRKSINKEELVTRLNKVHNGKYDYSKLDYTKLQENVTIICPIHGEFLQNLNSHLHGRGCPICAKEKRASSQSLTTEEFILKAKEIHGNEYDYSKVNYLNNHTNVCIICPKHGEFYQKPNNHLNGKGCPLCKGGIGLNLADFIQNAKRVHGEEYDYSKTRYINAITKVCIICKKHGEFWQNPSNHVSRRSGCPKCNMSKLEEIIYNSLSNNKILFIKEYSPNWLKLKTTSNLSLDFYIPSKNIAIECQGVQHFEPSDFKGGTSVEILEENLKSQQERDKHKKELCADHGIKVIYFLNEKYVPYMSKDDIYFTNEADLINYINEETV